MEAGLPSPSPFPHAVFTAVSTRAMHHHRRGLSGHASRSLRLQDSGPRHQWRRHSYAHCLGDVNKLRGKQTGSPSPMSVVRRLLDSVNQVIWLARLGTLRRRRNGLIVRFIGLQILGFSPPRPLRQPLHIQPEGCHFEQKGRARLSGFEGWSLYFDKGL